MNTHADLRAAFGPDPAVQMAGLNQIILSKRLAATTKTTLEPEAKPKVPRERLKSRTLARMEICRQMIEEGTGVTRHQMAERLGITFTQTNTVTTNLRANYNVRCLRKGKTWAYYPGEVSQ